MYILNSCSVLLGHSQQSEALVECSQRWSTIQTSRYVNVCVASPLWMLGHFPAFSFRLFYFFLEEVKMCLRGTGLLNKLKELKKSFYSFRLEIVNSHDDVCLPQIFPLFFFILSFEKSISPTVPANKMTAQQGRSWSCELFFFFYLFTYGFSIYRIIFWPVTDVWSRISKKQ